MGNVRNKAMTRGRLWLACLLVLLFQGSGAAQGVGKAPAAAAGKGFYNDSWALVIGINAYQNEDVPRLGYAVADAEAVAETLPALGFPRENIRLLLNQAATKARIEEMLYTAFPRMGPGDRLLVFFAGHGQTESLKSGGEEGYILPVDANPQSLPLTAIPMDALKRVSQRLKAKHQLFVLDACFSGFAMTRDIVPQGAIDTSLETWLRQPVVQVLTAGSKGEKSIEEGGHGLFTRRLLDGLGGAADREGRGLLTAAELGTWIQKRVNKDSRGQMTPLFGSDGEGQFIFSLGKPSASGPPPTVEPPKSVEPPKIIARPVPRQEFGSLGVTTNMPGVEVWLGQEKLGETQPGAELLVSNVPVGTHRITARRGDKTWEGTVEVIPYQKRDLFIELEQERPKAEPPKIIARPVPRQEFGSLSIRSNVPGVEVWLNQDRVGVTRAGTELLVPSIPPGTHRITARKGDKTWEGTVEVAANEKAELMIQLEQTRQKVIIGGDEERGSPEPAPKKRRIPIIVP